MVLTLARENDSEKKRAVSRELLLGLTLGSYATPAILLLPFGAWWTPPFDTQAFKDFLAPQPSALVFLIPGFLMFGLGWLQVRLGKTAKSKLNDRLTSIALWLNAVGALAFCLAGPLMQLAGSLDIEVIFGAAIAATFTGLVCAPAGFILSLFNIAWSAVSIGQARRSTVVP